FFFLLVKTGIAQQGTLDLSFNTTGAFQAQFYADNYHNVNKVLVQPDGKIIATGFSEFGGGRYSTTFRLKDDGTLDTQFATGGYSTVGAASSVDSRMNAMVLQPDGKIIVGGRAWQFTDDEFAMMRYNSNGTFDTTFGIGGGVTTDLSSVSFQGSDEINCLLLQPDGKIIAGGGRRTGAAAGEMVVVRYHANGTVDSTFGTNGMVTFPAAGGVDNIYASALQADGKILLTGTCQTSANIFFGRTIRINSNGSIDNGFGNNGMFDVASGGSSWVEMYGMALQPDGKIVLGANTNASANNDLFCVRLDTSGMPDMSFGNAGFAYSNSAVSALGYITQCIVIQPDGKILFGGLTGASNSLLVFRFNNNGTPDASYGTNGLVNLNAGIFKISISSLALQTDGNLIGGGGSQPLFTTNGSDLAVFRMHNTVGAAGVTENFNSEISIYPNPVDKLLTIRFLVNDEANYAATILDLAGKKVSDSYINNFQQTIDVSKLQNGIYFVQMKSKDKSMTQKIIVQH
ncbi:MAG: T9SS type A sorting domain-containing protein, partial [Bacteroidota bacterium]